MNGTTATKLRHSPRDDATSWLALGAIIGPLLFTLTWLVLGFVSTGYQLWDLTIETYSPISQPISGLGLGSTGPVMNSAFVLTGILIVVGAIGIFRTVPELGVKKRWTLTALLALHGIGTAICGLFTLESIMLHSTGFFLVLSPIVTFLVLRSTLLRIPRYERFGTRLGIASIVTLALSVLYFATFNPEAAGEGIGIAGLTQRILVVQLQAWIAALAWVTLRSRTATRPLLASRDDRLQTSRFLM